MDLNDMAAFAQVVTAGGFTAAARRAGVPKSNLSRRVARLEAALDARLLERTTRRLRLTEVGAAYLAHCRRILEEADQADAVVQNLRAGPRGRLHLGASLAVGRHLLAPLLARFLALYPEVSVELRLDNRRLDLLEEGLDLVVRVGTLEDSSLISRQLATSELQAVAAPPYLAARGAPAQPEDLAAHDLLAMSAQSDPLRWRFESEGGVRDLAVEPRVEVNDFAVLRRLVRDGAGIAVLPAYIVGGDLARGSLHPVLPAWRLPDVAFHALYPSRRSAAPKLRAMLDFLAAELPARAAGEHANVMVQPKS